MSDAEEEEPTLASAFKKTPLFDITRATDGGFTHVPIIHTYLIKADGVSCTPQTYEMIYDEEGRLTLIEIGHAHATHKPTISSDQSASWTPIRFQAPSITQKRVDKPSTAIDKPENI